MGEHESSEGSHGSQSLVGTALCDVLVLLSVVGDK
jgi:hypothetical protein